MNRIRSLVLVGLAAVAFATGAQAARIGVLSNNYAAATASDFTAHLRGHVFTPIDVTFNTPSLQSLVANYDAILLFEDGVFPNAPNVGDIVAQYARAGHPVALATFYDQDRTGTGTGAFLANGWGDLESFDPNTSDGIGAAYTPHTLNPASIVAHPLTAGVKSLQAQGLAGGNQAKPGTQVLATWAQPNHLGGSDPAIALRVTGKACIVQIGIAADYSVWGAFGSAYGGDFYRLWQNTFDFAATGCGVPEEVPATGGPALLLVSALLLASALAALRRRA
jgi:hypothetical protein